MGGMRRRWPLTGSALSSRLSQWTQPGFILSVQRGTIVITNPATSNTATITAVDVNNSRLRMLGMSVNGASTEDKLAAKIVLTNATTITATLNTAGTTNTTVSYEITSYVPGVIKSVQRSTVAAGSTATITTVNTAKAELDFLGFSTANTNTNIINASSIVLTNATTVTGTSVNSTATISFQVVEFY